MWKKIHVELEFYFFFFLAFKVLLCANKTTQRSIRSLLFFVRSLKTTQCSIRSFHFVRSFVFSIRLYTPSDRSCSSSNRWRPPSVQSDRSQRLSLFFVRSFLRHSSYSLHTKIESLRDSFLHFRTRVYKTRDLSGIILPTHQVEIEPLRLEF